MLESNHSYDQQQIPIHVCLLFIRGLQMPTRISAAEHFAQIFIHMKKGQNFCNNLFTEKFSQQLVRTTVIQRKIEYLNKNIARKMLITLRTSLLYDRCNRVAIKGSPDFLSRGRSKKYFYYPPRALRFFNLIANFRTFCLLF